MTTPTAVARAVARDAEQRARAALEGALTAHTQLLDADTAITAATQAKAAAGPALARAITAAPGRRHQHRPTRRPRHHGALSAHPTAQLPDRQPGHLDCHADGQPRRPPVAIRRCPRWPRPKR